MLPFIEVFESFRHIYRTSFRGVLQRWQDANVTKDKWNGVRSGTRRKKNQSARLSDRHLNQQ